MQKVKAAAGAMKRAELPPAELAYAVFCLRELGHLIHLKNHFFYRFKPWHNKAGRIKPE